MSLTLHKTPPKISLSGNDILFRVHSDNAFSNNGVQSILGFDLNTPPAKGDTLSFTWGNNAVVLSAETFHGNPDGLHFPEYSGTMLAYLESLVPYLRANYLLSKTYHIYWNEVSSMIHLVAYSVGPYYYPSMSGSTCAYDIGTSIPGQDQLYRNGYKIVLNVFKYVDPTTLEPHELLGEIRLTPGADGIVDFHIQDYLRPGLVSNYTYPEDSQLHVIPQPEMGFRYFVQYCEFYDNAYTGLINHNDVFFVYGGGVDDQKAVYYNSLNISFYDELVATQMFLTWFKGSKKVSSTQPEKLYYLNHSGSSRINFKLTIYFDDDTQVTKTLLATNKSDNDMIYEVCCGPAQLNLYAYAAKVLNYKIWVNDSIGNPISQEFWFELDYSFKKNDRVFLFQNSLNVYETFRSTGQVSKSNAFNFQTANVIQDNTLFISSQSNYSCFFEETFKANSGWLTMDELNWTNEFIISRAIFIIERWKLFQIVITSKKVFQHKDQENMYFIQFEYKKSLRSTAYSDIHSLEFLLDESAVPVLTEDEEFIYI